MDANTEHRLTAVEDRSRSNTKRLDEMEKRQDNLDDLVGTVKVLADREERIERDVKEMKTDLKEVTSKPGKQWDKVVSQIISIVIAAVIGYILAQIGLG